MFNTTFLRRRYLVTLVAMLLTLLSTAYGGSLNGCTVFVLYLSAVLTCAYFDGLVAGVLATGIAASLLVYQYVRGLPVQPAPNGGEFVTSLVVFVLTGCLATFLSCECSRSLKAAVQFHDTVAGLRDGVILLDSTGRVSFLNALAQTLTGWESKDARGKPVEEVFAVLDDHGRQPAVHPLAGLAHGQDLALPVRQAPLQARNGPVRPVEYWCEPHREAGLQTSGVSLFFRDVGQRVRAEKEQQGERERVRALADHAPVGLVWLDPDGRCTYANPAAHSLGGFLLEEGSAAGRGGSVHPDDRTIAAEWRACAAQGQPYTREFHLEDEHGQVRCVLLQSEVARSPEGRTIGHVGTLADITSIRDAERRLAEQEKLAEAARQEGEQYRSRAEVSVADLEQRLAEQQRTEEELRREQAKWQQDEASLRQELEALQQQEAGRNQDLQGWQKKEKTLKQQLADAREKETGARQERDALQGRWQEMEGALQRQIDFLQRTLESVEAGVVAWRDDGVPAVLNPAARTLLGLPDPAPPAEQWPGLVAARGPDGQAAPGTDDPFARAQRRQPFRSAEFVMTDHDGEARTLSASGKALARGGQPLGYVLTLLDITPHSRAQQDLRDRHAEERRQVDQEREHWQRKHTAHEQAARDLRSARAVLRSTAEGICVLDKEGDITFTNPAAERLLGRPAGELVGCSVTRFIEPAAAGDLPVPGEARWAPPVDGAIRREDVLVRRDGTTVPGFCTVSALEGDEPPGRTVLVLQDWTVPKRREDELRLQLERFEKTVQGTVGLWDRVTDQLRPLAWDLRDSSLAALGEQRARDGEPRGPAEVVERQSQRLVMLTEALWAATQIAQGNFTLVKETVEVGRVIDRAVRTFYPFLRERDQHLTVSLPLQPEWLLADPGRMEQVLLHLLDNAVRYTEPGGEIRLTAERRGNELVLQVQDSGIGLTPEQIGSLLTRSCRTQGLRENGGLGIGLAVVRGIVDLHGGTLEILSAGPNQGSEFVVRLPCLQPKPSGQVTGKGEAEAFSEGPLVTPGAQKSLPYSPGPQARGS